MAQPIKLIEKLFSEYQLLKFCDFFNLKNLKISNAILSLDLHWIVVELGGMFLAVECGTSSRLTFACSKPLILLVDIIGTVYMKIELWSNFKYLNDGH